MGASVGELLPGILGATFNSVISILVMYFILYFMLVDGKKMEASFFESVPLKDENLIMLRKDLNLLVYSNALGIPLIAMLQGIVALIGYIFIGVKEPVFWFVITCIGGMLPVIGAALGYIPLALLFFQQGDSGKGVIMLVYGFLVIGMVDNLFRLILTKEMGRCSSNHHHFWGTCRCQPIWIYRADIRTNTDFAVSPPDQDLY